MARPVKGRCVHADPAATVYKPRGVPVWMLEEQVLGWDELEALRLADLEGLYHEAAAERMEISRATFGRVLASAHRKVADALIHGKTIIFRGGHIREDLVRIYECEGCHQTFEVPLGVGGPETCPLCSYDRVHRVRCQGEEMVYSGAPGCCRRGRRKRAENSSGFLAVDIEKEPGEEITG